MASTSKDSESSRTLPPIEPLPPRYEPAADPRTIHVPGLDTGAPVQDQIEQIEQLITIRLQNIDANFARVHQILSTRILPAVRRFAINTEPVRESARFWVSFFEQAAQVRIPTTDEFSAATEDLSERDHDEQTSSTLDQTQLHDEASASLHIDNQSHSSFDPSSSFMPIAAGSSGAGAVSSTPMAHSHGRSRSQAHLDVGLTPSDAPSRWDESSISASIESPLDRLDRGLRSLKEDNANESHIPSHTSRSAPSTAGSSSLLQNVLSRNLSSTQRARTSPLKVHKKPVTPKHLRKDWDGIVDLRSPRPLKVATALDEDNWTDSDDDEDGLGLPPGMSPPVTMDFARPTWKATRPSKPSSSAKSGVSLGPNPGFKVAQSPVKAAAKRIGRDLVGAVERDAPSKAFAGAPSGIPSRFGYKPPAFSKAGPAPKASFALGRHVPDGGGLADASANSSISTPSLSGYSNRTIGIESSSEMEAPSLDLKPPSFGTADAGGGSATGIPSANESGSGIEASLEALMRQVGLSGDNAGANRMAMDDSFNSEDSFDADMMNAPVFGALGGLQPPDNGGDSDSDSSSEGDGMSGRPGAPGAGFLMASGGIEDDSFDDDLDERGAFPAFPTYGEDEDDPTIFGARTVAARASAVFAELGPSRQGGSLSVAHLRLHSQELSDDENENDTGTIGMRIGGLAAGVSRERIPETPTPWNGLGRGN